MGGYCIFRSAAAEVGMILPGEILYALGDIIDKTAAINSFLQ